MLTEAHANSIIPFYDKQGRSGTIRYADLMIELGEGRKRALSDCLLEEQDRVVEFNRLADKLSRKIRQLDPFYDEIDADPHGFFLHCQQQRQDLHKAGSAKRLQILNTYYTRSKTHARILRELTTHLLAGSEGDHSAHQITLIQRAVDVMCRVMRHVHRKTRRAAAVHSLEAARGAAKNGLRVITIIPTLLHDQLEEELDSWTEKMVAEELRDPFYGDCCGQSMGQIPIQLRHRIIQKHIEAYNDQASAIFFKIALTLYDHIRYFPSPGRYYETLHSIMQIISALSRRRDMSYYTYLKNLLYPKPTASLDTMPRARLIERLTPEFPNPRPLLNEYLRTVHNFYETTLGSFSSKDEVRRNAFREMLAKILDRLNNTRDMDRDLGFSISKRLYGTGFKNIFFLQALEDKFRKPSFNTEERRLIEVKFIHKPKIAALYQCLDDLEYLKREHVGAEMIDFLYQEIDRYRGTRSFRRLTPPGRPGYFNGLIYLFNEVTLGRKANLVELEKRSDKQAEVLVAFKAVLESYLVYPTLIREEQQALGFKQLSRSAYRPYRIEGMGPGLERRSTARKEQAVDLLNLKTFSRRII
jgi:hypothetical protein